MILRNGKLINALIIIKKTLFFSLRNACFAFTLMSIVSFFASRNIDEETLKSFASLWDIPLTQYEGLVRLGLFGFAVMNSMASAFFIIFISFIGRLAFICVKYSYKRFFMAGDYNDRVKQ